MSPLYAVLDAIQHADGPLSLYQLARQLDIEPSAAQGMIDFWVQKGRLRVQGSDAPTCTPSGCSTCDTGPTGCPLLLYAAPRRYEVVK